MLAPSGLGVEATTRQLTQKATTEEVRIGSSNEPISAESISRATL